MRFLFSLISTALLSFIAGLYLPWWSIALIAFIVALCIQQRAGMAFLSAFLAIFFSWGIMAWFINVANAGILADRVSELLKLGKSQYLLIFITGIIGGLVAGFAALSASYLGKK